MKNGFYFLGLCICLCLWASCSSMEEVRDYNEKYTGEYTSRIAFPIGGLGTGMFCVEGSGAISNGEFYQFNLSSCIRQQNSLTAQFVSFSLANLANIFHPPPPDFYNN